MKLRFSMVALFLVAAGARTLEGQAHHSEDPPLRLERRTLEVAEGEEIVAEIGYLPVPECRADPKSRQIELAVARIPSSGDSPRTPLVFFAGGPGSSGTESLWRSASLSFWRELSKERDIILLDQRGTGRSKPKLVVPAEHDPAALFLDRESAVTYFASCFEAAVAHFQSSGLALEGYTTRESADDVEDLRRALGLEKINLLGFSYGTHLALEVVRRHGDHVENAVGLSVAGPEHLRKLPSDQDHQIRVLSRAIAADASLSKEIPDLEALLESVLHKLREEPVVVRVKSPRNQRRVRIPVGEFGLRLLLVFDLSDPRDLSVYPRLLWELNRGDAEILAWFVEKRLRQFSDFHLMSLLMRAASEAGPERWRRIAKEARTSLLGNAANIPFPELRDRLSLPDLGPSFRIPVASEVRSLFVTGSLDVNTPPHQAESLRRSGMKQATHLTIKNGGHEDVWSPDVAEVVTRFLRGEDVTKVSLSRPPIHFLPLQGIPLDLSHPSVKASRNR